MLLLVGCIAVAWPQETTSKRPADGVYAVLRDSVQKKVIMPLKKGEILVVHHFKYLKKDTTSRPRYLVVRSVPDVKLELAEAPVAEIEGKQVIRVLLKLSVHSARALETLTTDYNGRQLTIIIGGEVVTSHKIREVIKGGEIQITNCAPGAANYLFEHLQVLSKKGKVSEDAAGVSWQ